jgi:CheY-like chemotaxis protein
MTVSHKPRVLIVDDEPALRELLHDALCEGLEISTASSGQQALTMAQESRPDILVTDLCLGDCTGLEVIDRMRLLEPDMPAVLITGHAEVAGLSNTSLRRPVEVFNKPLDLGKLKEAISSELSRRATKDRDRNRRRHLRRLARHYNLQRKNASPKLDTNNADLAKGYQKLSLQVKLQKLVMDFQRDLLIARQDDDVFKSLFTTFVSHSGPLYGAAMVCDSQAQLQLAGRFGVPTPDPAGFCLSLASPIIDASLADPRPKLLDAGDEAGLFDASIRKYLIGLSVLSIPLMPADGEMIGLVLLYRKGEQPFLESDLSLAEMISLPTALAVQRNE